MALLTPLYLDSDDVYQYILNKVDVGNDANLQQVSEAVFASWVRNGEVKVEQDLRPFYTVPFQTVDGGEWTELPPTTYGLLWTLLSLRAELYILEQQFGRIMNSVGSDYLGLLRTEYKDYLNQFYMKTGNGTYILGQAEFLAVNPNANNSNGLVPPAEGYTSIYSSAMEYAARQINNPPVTWYNSQLYASYFRERGYIWNGYRWVRPRC